MIYVRKKHWVSYHSDKCKLYLRNDFHFECAYCGMHEQDNTVAKEDIFTKDHFVPKASNVQEDLDCYSNMVYACFKCNGTKLSQNPAGLLDPCQDDIYGGESPHVKKLGEQDHYRVIGLTDRGRDFIEKMKLNSRYYRTMREIQFQKNEKQKQLQEIIRGLRSRQQIDESVITEIQNTISAPPVDEDSDAFRCGSSKAGEQLYEVLQLLKGKGISYKLILEDEDLDVVIQLEETTYYCEVRTNDSSAENETGPRLAKEKLQAWQQTGKNCGILYYYPQKQQLELYVYTNGRKEKKVFLNC